MALDPADVTDDMTVYGTWTRVHPRTGEPQTRAAESAAEAVSMRWHGWVRLDDGDTPTGPTVKTTTERSTPAPAAAKPAKPKPAESAGPTSP